MISKNIAASADRAGRNEAQAKWRLGLHFRTDKQARPEARATGGNGLGRVIRLTALLTALVFGLSGCAIFSPGSSVHGRAAAKTAHKYIGVPYKLGGTTPKTGFDCSSLVQYVYARHGVKLPRSSAQQAKAGRKVRKSQLQPGDLVFFATGKRGRVSHVGIYIGNDQFIHAPGKGKKVTKAPLSSKYFKKTFHSARRVG